MNVNVLCTLAIAVACTAATGGATVTGAPLTLYVSRNGNDAWSGRLAAPNKTKTDGPFATLERARDEIRRVKAAGGLPKGGVTAEIRRGVYERSQAFELTKEDSGTEELPIVYRSRNREQVRLVGGKVVTGWDQVTDPAVLTRMDGSARGKVWRADLKAQGITDLGAMEAGSSWGASSPGLEVFFADLSRTPVEPAPMTLARWPNEGYVTIPQVLGPTPQDIRGTKGCMEGIFSYEGERPNRWVGEKDVMLHGYWFWDWADQRLKVVSIDAAKKVITLEAKPQHHYGFRKGMYYYAYNLLPELDRPGEWYLDRDNGYLYFWPPTTLTKAQVIISIVPTLVKMNDVAHVALRGMTFECTRGTALVLHNVTHCRIAGCVIRNTGSWAVSLTGRDSGVVGCDIYNTADGGVNISGGDRKKLIPAGLHVDNCHIYRYGRWNPICKPAVYVDGVGNRMTHNLINDGPHMAVMWGGNDHLFEYNEMHSVVKNANDAGIMYAGYNPAMRGHIIRYNYFHHVYGFQGKGCNGIYLDDMFCSATILGNIFYKVPRAAFIGGGHDNIVDNNIFVDCRPALHVDARMMGWAAASVPIMKQRLEEVPYKEEPWRSKYPQLLTYLQGDYSQPRGNIVTRNICWGGKWDEIEDRAQPGVKLENNLVGEDPRFFCPEKQDFRLKPNSPAWKLGFERIPVERIGLYKDEFRVSWPVRTTVDPPPIASAAAARPICTGTPVVFRVSRAVSPVKVDGTSKPDEWQGAVVSQAMVIDQNLNGERTKPRSLARLAYDATALLVAVDNEVSRTKPLQMGNQWGRDDAVELAFRNSDLKEAPILILRGYPSSHFETSDEVFAPVAAVKKAAEGVGYRAKVVNEGRWTAEWRIPFASLGIDTTKQTRFAFSPTVRKSAGPEWVLWMGTHRATWQVDNAGFLELR